MIKQKETKIITSAYTTSDADVGYRLICNSADAFEITLHSPTGRTNFDLEIDNIGTGVVSCNSMQIKPNTHAHLGNTGTAWILAISDLEMTKAEIESVLTGELDSHSHPVVYELPTGGTAGQVLAKVDGTDYNAEWVVPVCEESIGLVTTYKNSNSATKTITITETSCFLTSFDMVSPSKLLIHFTGKIIAIGAIKVSAKIYANNKVQLLIPEQTCTAGSWMFVFQVLTENLAAGTTTVDIKLYTDTGTCTIDTGQGELTVQAVTSDEEVVNYELAIDIANTVPSIPTVTENTDVVLPEVLSISITNTAPNMPTVQIVDYTPTITIASTVPNIPTQTCQLA